MSQYVQYQSPEPGKPKWSKALVKVINNTCVFPALTC